MYCHLLFFAVCAAIFAPAFADSKPPRRLSCLCCYTPPGSPACEVGNICFALDQSGYISRYEDHDAKEFVDYFSETASYRSESKPFFSAVAFSDDAEVIRSPTDDLREFLSAVRRERHLDGDMSISAGLIKCREQLMCAQGKKTIVLLSGGEPSEIDMDFHMDIARGLKQDGVTLVTAAVGCDANVDHLKQLAGSEELFMDLSIQNMCDNIRGAVQATCEAEGSSGGNTCGCSNCGCNTCGCNSCGGNCGGNTCGGHCGGNTCGGNTCCTDDCCNDPHLESCLKAFNKCDFRFEGYNGPPTFDVTGAADTSFTPLIVSKNTDVELGVLNMNDMVPQFIEKDGAHDITAFGSQPFTPTSFKPYSIENTRGSGIGHQTFHGDQKQLARNRCVRVSFSEMQLWDGDRADNVSELPPSKCVVFRTK